MGFEKRPGLFWVVVLGRTSLAVSPGPRAWGLVVSSSTCLALKANVGSNFPTFKFALRAIKAGLVLDI